MRLEEVLCNGSKQGAQLCMRCRLRVSHLINLIGRLDLVQLLALNSRQVVAQLHELQRPPSLLGSLRTYRHTHASDTHMHQTYTCIRHSTPHRHQTPTCSYTSMLKPQLQRLHTLGIFFVVGASAWGVSMAQGYSIRMGRECETWANT